MNYTALGLVGIMDLQAENAGNTSSGVVESVWRSIAMRIGLLGDGPSPGRCRGEGGADSWDPVIVSEFCSAAAYIRRCMMG